MKFKKKYKDGVDDLVIDQKLNDAESERMMEVNTPKKSLKTQYSENKGGYKRALASGKKDKNGNVIDPNTGLAYKILSKATPTLGNYKPKVSLAPVKTPSLTSITAKQIAQGKPTKVETPTAPKARVGKTSPTAYTNPLTMLGQAFSNFDKRQKESFKQFEEKRRRTKNMRTIKN